MYTYRMYKESLLVISLLVGASEALLYHVHSMLLSTRPSNVPRHSSKLCWPAAVLGLSLELLSGSLIAPSGQEIQPNSAAKQWVDAASIKDIPAHAWAAVGLSVDAQVRQPFTTIATTIATLAVCFTAI